MDVQRGYGSSESARLGVQQLSDNTGMVSCVVTRLKQDGSVLERLGATYTFRKADSAWKIVVLAIHDADAVLDLPQWSPRE